MSRFLVVIWKHPLNSRALKKLRLCLFVFPRRWIKTVNRTFPSCWALAKQLPPTCKKAVWWYWNQLHIQAQRIQICARFWSKAPGWRPGKIFTWHILPNAKTRATPTAKSPASQKWSAATQPIANRKRIICTEKQSKKPCRSAPAAPPKPPSCWKTFSAVWISPW